MGNKQIDYRFKVLYALAMLMIVLSWCNNLTEGPIIPILSGIVGIAFWMRIAEVLTPVIGKSRYINAI